MKAIRIIYCFSFLNLLHTPHQVAGQNWSMDIYLVVNLMPDKQHHPALNCDQDTLSPEELAREILYNRDLTGKERRHMKRQLRSESPEMFVYVREQRLKNFNRGVGKVFLDILYTLLTAGAIALCIYCFLHPELGCDEE